MLMQLYCRLAQRVKGHLSMNKKQKNVHRFLLRTFYEKGRFTKPEAGNHQTRWLWRAVVVLTIACIMTFVQLEFVVIEQAKLRTETESLLLNRHSMTHIDKNINLRFTKKQNNL